MRRLAVAVGGLLGLAILAVAAHLALIEVGQEVIVLRTQEPDGSWLTSRLWIVDDAGGTAWLHGGDSHWMHNLEARPEVEVVRRGETRHYRATAVPGPHPELHALLRVKYGFADWWVRTIGPDTAAARPVRLDPL